MLIDINLHFKAFHLLFYHIILPINGYDEFSQL